VESRTAWLLYVNTSNLAAVTSAIPSHLPYLLGHGYLIDASVLLPGPQPNLGAYLKDVLGMSFSGGGITVGLFGEAYVNWGVVGAVAVSFITGIAYWVARRRIRVTDSLDLAWLLLFSINAAGVMQTGFVSVALYNLVPLTGLYLAMRWLRGKTLTTTGTEVVIE